MHPSQLSISDFTYALPENRIALFPLPERDQSRLLIYRDHTISEDTYSNIAGYIPDGAMLVFNNSRVVEARIIFQKPTGGIIEIFALEPHSQYTDVTTAMQAKGMVWWKCLIGGAGKWKKGQTMQKQQLHNESSIILNAKIVERSTNSFTVEFFLGTGIIQLFRDPSLVWINTHTTLS